MSNGPVTTFLEAAIRAATPLACAALGETLVERAGIVNLGLEGIVLSGAFGALAGARWTGGTAGGYALGAAAGLLVAMLFAVFVLWIRADQIIAGTATTLLAVGLTGTMYRTFYGATGAALTTPTSSPVALPGLSHLPFVGPALFDQPLVTYWLYLLVPALWWWMRYTHAGLALRATGENPEAALAVGIRVRPMRVAALAFSGALGGLGGATLVLAQAGTFAEGMSAGRGFIALAIVVLGRWSVPGVAAAAVLFGLASAAQYGFQSLGLALPYQLFLALPYVLTLAVLAGWAGKGRGPAALGRAV